MREKLLKKKQNNFLKIVFVISHNALYNYHAENIASILFQALEQMISRISYQDYHQSKDKATLVSFFSPGQRHANLMSSIARSPWTAEDTPRRHDRTKRNWKMTVREDVCNVLSPCLPYGLKYVRFKLYSYIVTTQYNLFSTSTLQWSLLEIHRVWPKTKHMKFAQRNKAKFCLS